MAKKEIIGTHNFLVAPTLNDENLSAIHISATTAPTSTDDSSAGYYEGFLWVKQDTNQVYVCSDDTVSAAVWDDITAAGGGSPPFADTNSIVEGSADNTKELRFEVDGNTTAIIGVIATQFTTAKTITIPDATDTLVGKATVDVLTNKTVNDFTNDVAADEVHVQVRNESGVTINRGDPVYVSGYSIGQDLPLVSLADASSSATMPAFGIVASASIANNANGEVYISGRLPDFDTSSFSAGNVLYVSNVGTTGNGLTATKPTGTDLIQSIGEVLRSHATLGVLEIEGAGRVNDTPNVLTHDLDAGAFSITNLTSIGLNDTDSAFNLLIQSTSTITTADKTLTLDVNDSDRTLTISGDATVSGTNTGNETLSSINALAITTVGTIDTGVWEGTAIATGFIAATLTGKALTGVTTLSLDDTDSAFNLIIESTSTITTADKTLTIDVNDANRTLIIGANVTLDGNTTIDHTSVTLTAGTGLAGGGDISANRSFSLAVDELAEKTGDLVGSDRLTGTSGTTNFSETISAIPLSIFNDDLVYDKTFNLPSPTSGDDEGIWMTDVAITITKVKTYLKNGTSVLFNLRHNTDPTAGTADLWSSNQTANTLTSVQTHSTSFNDATLAAGEALRFIGSTVTGSVDNIVMTIFYTID